MFASSVTLANLGDAAVTATSDSRDGACDGAAILQVASSRHSPDELWNGVTITDGMIP
jgi:hypothetical protein